MRARIGDVSLPLMDFTAKAAEFILAPCKICVLLVTRLCNFRLVTAGQFKRGNRHGSLGAACRP